MYQFYSSTYLIFVLCCAYGASKKPHVVLIVADDLGYNDVGFRNKDIISPNIDKVKIYFSRQLIHLPKT